MSFVLVFVYGFIVEYCVFEYMFECIGFVDMFIVFVDDYY